MNNIIKELQYEIERLDEELKKEIYKFNENVSNHLVGVVQFSVYFFVLGCETVPYNPYESSLEFYEKFNGIFEYIPKFKNEYPDHSPEEIHYAIIKYCTQEDEQINSYLWSICGYQSDTLIVDKAGIASVVYKTLDYFGFNDIIAKQKLIRKKQEELERLKNIEDSLTEENQENAQENETVIDKQSSENRTDRFGKVKELLNSKAKKLIKRITSK